MKLLNIVLSVIVMVVACNGAAVAQGTKDPSNPVPTMVFPIRPRDQPTSPPPVIQRRQTPPPPILLQSNQPGRSRPAHQ